ncbi:PRC-barrel-like,Translation protein, beta-barrel domain,PRC-barrel domain,RimM protein,16S rRNA processing [Cinara cedri]|uniref:PRC-barrel-like,Translation protein, beta-barrel domain,PRC-barrel domain,RimM protein,16S rRNA processing n=1 Tax=Cinara cedri TaxID=506608 RepID=A0A5E4MUG2_9HEMI|nr:PRC-barrel-like,Translation protein, beta-barrel domain,PRC-barrel domain,RimM protein,16S rRNA processing [Cinara cedri]
MDMDRLVCLGIITSPHGIKGAVKIKTFTEKPENIFSYGELINGDESYKIDSISTVGDNLAIATLNGVNSCDEAELLRNKKLYATQDKLPELDNKNQFYHNDLIGMEVKLENNESYGYVTYIHNFGSGDILEIIATSTKKNIMLSFTQEIFPHINVKKRYMVLSIPEFVD